MTFSSHGSTSIFELLLYLHNEDLEIQVSPDFIEYNLTRDARDTDVELILIDKYNINDKGNNYKLLNNSNNHINHKRALTQTYVSSCVMALINSCAGLKQYTPKVPSTRDYIQIEKFTFLCFLTQ